MRHPKLKQLRTLSTVVHHGTMARAAAELGLTPPAVTIQLRQLEEEAGLALLERSSEGLRPTDAGRALLHAASRIEDALTECVETLDELKGLSRGKVSVAVVSTAKYFAPRALAAFARSHPSIEVQLAIGNREETIQALDDYRVDIAIMGRPPRRIEVESDLIGAHPHVIIAPTDHPKLDKGRLPPAALADETFLLREAGSGTRKLMEYLFASVDVQPNIGMQISSNETIKQAVMAGLGIALISAHTVATELHDGRLRVLDVEGMPVIRDWFVVKLRDKRLLPAAQAMRSFLVAEGEGFLPQVDNLIMPVGSPRRTKKAVPAS